MKKDKRIVSSLAKEIRQSGWTVEQAAKLWGVTSRTVRNWAEKPSAKHFQMAKDLSSLCPGCLRIRGN